MSSVHAISMVAHASKFILKCINLRYAFLFISLLASSQVAALTVSASFSPSTVVKGKSSKLSWSSVGAQQCTIDGKSYSGGSGSKTYSNITANKSVKVSCLQTYSGSASKTAKVVVVSPPTSKPSSISYDGTSYTGRSVTVRWGGAGGTVGGYKLEQKTNSGSWAQIYDGGSSSRSRVISDLAQGSSYQFRVRAYNSYGHTSYRTSGTVLSVVSPLTISTSTTTSGTFSITWQPVNGGMPRVEKSYNSGGWVAAGSPGNPGAFTRSYTETSNGTYRYRVIESECNNYCVPFYTTPIVSIVVNRPVAPSLPASLNAVTQADGSVDLSWGAASGTITAYQLYSASAGSSSWTSRYSGTSLSASVSGLNYGSWDFRVRACNTSASCSDWRKLSGYHLKKDEFLNLSTTQSSDGKYSLNWSADESFGEAALYENGVALPVDGASGSKSYQQTLNGNYTYVLKSPTCYMPCQEYRVVSSKTVSVNIPPPSVPANFQANASSGSTAVNLSWQASTGVLAHYLLSGSRDGVNWTSFFPAASRTSTSASFSLPSVGNWTFKIEACGNNGCSAAASVSAMIGTKPILAAAPTVSTDGKIHFNWEQLNTQQGANLRTVIVKLKSNGNEGVVSPNEIDTTKSSGAKTISESVNGDYRYELVQYVEELVPGMNGRVDTIELFRSNTVEVKVNIIGGLIWGEASAIVGDAPFFPGVRAPDSNTVGSIAGQANVSGGSASYAFSVAVPPGRNGAQPQVGLNYSSRGGNGIAGVGWSLSAGSAISRCGASYAQDKITRGVQYSNSDKLCLNGQRLMVVSGTYGQANAQYRTELDSFVRVTQAGGNLNSGSSWFKAEYKNGTVAYFGNSANSKLIPIGAPGTLTWLVNYQHDQVRDSSGSKGKNYIHYTYKDFGSASIGRERLLNNIYYTGNGELSKGDRRVEFNYQSRSDISNSYLAGGKSRSSLLLNTINTYVDNVAVSEYFLNYKASGSQASQRSLLQSVMRCGYDLNANQQCLPSTDFEWLDTRTIKKPEAVKLGGVEPFAGKVSLHDVMPMGDMDGNGSRDFPGINTDAEQGNVGANSQSTHTSCHRTPEGYKLQCIEMDADRDGINDTYKFDGGKLYINYSSESGGYHNTGIKIFIPGSGEPNGDLNRNDSLSLSDVNGDGFPDLVVYEVYRDYYRDLDGNTLASNRNDTGRVRLLAYLHKGGSAVASSYFSTTARVILKSCLSTGQSKCLKPTLRTAGNPIYAVQFSGDSGYKWLATQYASPIGDVDGNGLVDFVVTDSESSSVPVPKFFLLNHSTPNSLSFTEKPIEQNLHWVTGNTLGLNFDGPALGFFYQFIDLNGDGVTDMIGWKTGQLVFWLNQGNGEFGEAKPIALASNDTNIDPPIEMRMHEAIIGPGGQQPVRHYSPKYNNSLKVADINGDGRPELLMPGDRLITTCATWVSGVELCGDELYGAYASGGSGTNNTAYRSDWLDDSIYRYHALYFDDDGQGGFNLRKEKTDFIGSAHESALIDAFGDGNLDMLTAYGLRYSRFPKRVNRSASSSYWLSVFNREGAYIARNYGSGGGESASDYQPVDVLSKVTNGYNLKHKWQYRPLSTSTEGAGGKDLYHTSHDYIGEAGDGYFHFGSSMYVVQSFDQSDGIGGFNSTRYGYRGAVYNNQGRGFMGFRSVIAEDLQSELISHSDFKQVFPNAGTVQYQATFTTANYPAGFDIFGNEDSCLIGGVIPNTQSALSFSETCYRKNTDHASRFYGEGVQHWYAHNSKTVSRDLHTPADIIATKTAEITLIDQWGNPRSSTQTLSDAYGSYQTDTVVSIDDSHENDWWLNKVESSSVTAHAVANRHAEDAYQLSGHSGLDNTTTTTTTNAYTQANVRLPSRVNVSSSDVTAKASVINSTFNDYGLPLSVSATASVLGEGGAWSNKTRALSTISDYSKNGVGASDDGYFPLTIVNALGHSSRSHYDAGTGAVIDSWRDLDANNDTHTATDYDPLGRPIEIRTQGLPPQYLGYSTSPDVPHSALKVETTQAGSPAQAVWQDALGRTLRKGTQNFDGKWIYTDTAFNARGQITFQTVPHEADGTLYGVRYSGYDALGRPGSKVTDQICGDTTTEYSYSGLTTEIVAATGACSGPTLDMSRTYNSLKQLVQTVDSKGGTTRYAYSAQGSPIVIRDALGNNIIAEYDGLGRKTSVIDPNQGSTEFEYNGFGELQREQRQGAHEVKYYVDLLGRTTKRSATGEGDLVYAYDSADNGYGQLAFETGAGLTRNHSYNSNGQATTISETHSGKTFTTQTLFDTNYGRPKGLVYPNGLTLKYDYSETGYLSAIKNAATDYSYRTVESMDVWGNVRGAKFGNSVQHFADHSPVTGQMLQISASNSVATLHDIRYDQYDGFGNIKSLTTAFNGAGEGTQTFTETYDYDSLHRLTNNTIVGTAAINYDYDAIGNLTFKSDYASDYDYTGGSNGGPNAVKRALTDSGWVDFSYDARGNMTSGDGLSSALYNAMDKPTVIEKNGASLSFSYGPGHMRYKQVKQKGGQSVTTLYAGGKLYEEEVTSEGTTQRAYIGDFAIASFDPAGAESLRYQHKDRLGSARTMTDASGMVVNQRNFDPFGKPREVDGGFKVSAVLGDLASAKTNRGFTAHEHLDEAELIHMNGRVYDYNLGRFMSVDPFIQAPGNSQSINPYSYVMNNPLAGVDPTGYQAYSMKGAGGYTMDFTGGAAIGLDTSGATGNMAVAMTAAVSKDAAKTINNGAESLNEKSKPADKSEGSDSGGNKGGVADTMGGQGSGTGALLAHGTPSGVEGISAFSVKDGVESTSETADIRKADAQQGRYQELIDIAHGSLESKMDSYNSGDYETWWGAESLGMYIYFDEATGKHSLSSVFMADTANHNFMSAKAFKGSGTGGIDPPHPRTRGWVARQLGITDEKRIVSKVVRQFQNHRYYDLGHIYQKWANRIPGSVHVSFDSGKQNEIYQPK